MPDLGFAHVYEPAPAGRAAPGAPTFLALHGTGGNEHDLVPLAQMIDPTAGVLSARGKVLESGRSRFFRRLAEGVFDIEDLKFRTSELADFVAAASAQYGFDPASVVAAGYSNGANIAASLLLLRPGTLRAAILFSPMVPLEPPAPPDLAGVDVFIGAGRADPLVEPAQAQRLAEMLRQAGAAVTLRWQPGGHELTPHHVATARAWYRQLDLSSPPHARAEAGRGSRDGER